MTKSEARRQILDAANRNRLSNRHLTMKDIHKAVAIVRHYKLVTPDVLKKAGFR